jgi:hypothetical protein
MKNLLTLIFIVIIGFYNAQCDNGTNYYPSTAYTPSNNTWGSATSYNWAGEIIRVNITTGDEYEFSTCGNHGGVNASYDTQLTLIDELGVIVDFNDDFAGCTGYTSYIKHTAAYTGVLYVHLTEYNCVSNSTSTEVMIYKTPASTGGGSSGGTGNEVTIGDPNSTLNDGRVPAYGYYDYSWSASIYTVAELGGVPLTMEKISWNVLNGNSMILNNQEIWMAMKPEEIFHDGTMPEAGAGPWDEWKKVYDGPISFVPGWNEVVLQGAYGWDGVRNLVVKVVNNHGSYALSYPEFQYTAKSNSVVYNYSDGSFPSSNGYTNSIRPNTVFGHQGGGNALPIVLVSFNGEVSGNVVHIEWTVASQINNDYFTVQKSTDLEQWSLVDSVIGAGTTNTQLSYFLNDYNPHVGYTYYRLRQVDYDGKSETFHPIAIQVKGERKRIIKTINIHGQEIDSIEKGFMIHLWDNGTVTKVIK